jgi:hypothetical protein
MAEVTRRPATSLRPAIAFVGAAIVVVLVIGLPAIFSQTGVEPEGAETPSATMPAPSTTTASTMQPSTTTVAPVAACGTELPFATVLPDDFDGPFPGASTDSPDPAEEGQFILHWIGRGGSVELRLPANAEYTESAQWGALPTQEDPDPTVFVIVQDVTIDGIEYPDAPQGYGVLPTEAMSGPCDAVQLRILGPADGAEPSLLDATFGMEDPDRPNTLVIYPELPRAWDLHLIVDSLAVDSVPAVLECGGSPGVTDVPPIKIESITDPVVYEEPVEALEAVLAGPDAVSWPKTGYFELHEPDGSITYGNPLDDMSPDPRPDGGLVISISVVQVEGGWAVDSWSTSGC